MRTAKIVAITLALVLALAAGTLIALTYDNPVSFGCRHACAHVDGPGYIDCVLMCESYQ